MKYHDGQICLEGDTIATSRQGTCKVLSTERYVAKVRNIITKEEFEMCDVGISDSDLIDRKNKDGLIGLHLEADEDGGQWQGYGKTIVDAMQDLRKRIEGDTCPFHEGYVEIWQQATEALEAGQKEYREWDFSLPEEAFTITVI